MDGEAPQPLGKSLPETSRSDLGSFDKFKTFMHHEQPVNGIHAWEMCNIYKEAVQVFENYAL